MNDAAQAIRAIRDLGGRVVTFSGFSSNGYEDRAGMERIVSGILDELDATSDIVCSGATSVGIGAVYALAAARGFRSIGIVSANALREQVQFADDVKIVFVIADDTWGGFIDKHGTPSPTSRVMVDASDELIFIGGGDIARDEYEYASRVKTPRFFAADMNHDLAIRKAMRQGQPPPSDFRGALEKYLAGSSD
jgi:hypothetical protein